MRHAASAPEGKKHAIADYAALVGETQITRCPIWCPFDFGFYAIRCRSVRHQNPKNIQKTKLLDSCCGAMQISAKWAKSHFESGAFNRALPPLRVLLFYLRSATCGSRDASDATGFILMTA